MPVDAPASPPVDTLGTGPKAVPPPTPKAPSPTPVTPPKSARAAVSDRLKELAKAGPDPEIAREAGLDVPPKPPDKPAEKPPEKPPEKPVETPPKVDNPPDVQPPKGKEKTGPWQLKEKWEKTAKAWEQRAVVAEQKIAQMGDTDVLRQRTEKAEARLKVLEDEIRYVDYTKSDEFKTKYQAPYEEAWAKAVSDLKELPITLEDGSSRPATAQDLVHLANLPLGEARKLAKQLFGDAADDVMAHRRRVRELSEAQQKAIDEAKKTGSQREQEQRSQMTKAAEESVKLFSDYNSQDEKKYDFLKSKEGDDEWNGRLESAKKLVDEAFAANARDPTLTPEQRADIVRKHASVRGRAIGFSLRSLENKRLQGQIATLTKELAQYKGGEPTGGNGKGQTTPTGAPGSELGRALAELRKRAQSGPIPVT